MSGYTDVDEYDDWKLVDTHSWMSVDKYEQFYKSYGNYSGCFLWVHGEKTYESAKWKVGDYVEVTLKPAAGYTASAINDTNGNKISEGISDTMYVQLKESGNSIVPVFKRNDCGVTFLFEGNTDGLYVFHDKKNKADETFTDALYKDTTDLTNWADENGLPVSLTKLIDKLVKEDGKSDISLTSQIIDKLVFTGNLTKKIKENYDNLRKEQKLNGQKLSNLAIGDVVTVYAEAPDGYIPYWYTDDGNKTVTTENDKIYARHYGNSFSFEMTSNDVTLYCGMDKKAAENYILTGKLVKPSQTLKGKGYSQVNPQIAESYMTISDAALSVVNFDERKDSVVIDGVKYYSSVTTDKDGNLRPFQVLCKLKKPI